MNNNENMDEMIDSHWDLFKPLMKNDSTKDYEYIRYEPEQGNLLTPAGNDNKSTPFSIKIKDLNRYVLLNKAKLYAKFKIVNQTGGANYGLANEIALINNAWNLFSRVEYRMDNKLVETNDEPGINSTIMNLVDYSPSYSKKVGPAQFWYPDESNCVLGGAVDIAATPTTARRGFGNASMVKYVKHTNNALHNENAFYNDGFRSRVLRLQEGKECEVLLPLDRVLGVANIDIAWRGVTHQLTLNKNTEYSRILHSANAVDAGRTVITELALYIPDVEPSFEMASQLEQELAEKNMAKYMFHNMRTYRSDSYGGAGSAFNVDWKVTTTTSRPLKIYVCAMLNTQLNNQAEDAAIVTAGANGGPTWETSVNGGIFHPLLNTAETATYGINEMSVRVNNKIYPREDYDISFNATDGLEYSRLYMDFLNSGGNKFHDSEGAVVSYEDYKYLYPVMCFDVSHDNGLFNKVKSLDINIRSKGVSAAAFRFFCTVVTEQDLQVSSAKGNLVVQI